VRILVAGATGFVGRRLSAALVAAGHDVLAMTRRPAQAGLPGKPVRADVDRPETLLPALRGCDTAYYLVHSLDRADFVRRDAAAAREFGTAAARAGLRRIVYLGGLGDPADDLSDHLRSRQEVETLLGAAGVPVTTLRAGIVIGAGSTSWTLIRRVVERVPTLLVPRWTLTRTQPIALPDALRYLLAALDDGMADGGSATFEIGGAEVLRYIDLLSRTAALGGRPTVIVPVPVPSARLANLVAAQALPLLTGVDSRTILSLLESLRNEVVVRDDRIRAIVPFEPMDFDHAVQAALAETGSPAA
jgi:uncharacterized protein YbjT (DUF2867 family)